MTFAFEDCDGNGGYVSVDAATFAEAVREFRLLFGGRFRILYVLGS